MAAVAEPAVAVIVVADESICQLIFVNYQLPFVVGKLQDMGQRSATKLGGNAAPGEGGRVALAELEARGGLLWPRRRLAMIGISLRHGQIGTVPFSDREETGSANRRRTNLKLVSRRA